MRSLVQAGGWCDEPAAPTGATHGFRRRWLSPRALGLHLAVLVIAPGCGVACWWQATRALGGNDLSWFYSVEWPAFSVLAVVGWWQLIHEDPEALRARRRQRGPDPDRAQGATATAGLPDEAVTVARVTASSAWRLTVGVGVELLLGIMATLAVPFDRPNGWWPSRGRVIYLVHGVVGALVLFGALVLTVRAGRLGRMDRIVAWTGLVGVAVAGAGGLLTTPRSLVRFLGLVLMGLGACLAALAYLIPVFLERSARSKPEPSAALGVGPARPGPSP